MIDNIRKLFSKGTINEQELIKNCSLGEMVFCSFDFTPWRCPVVAKYIPVNITTVSVNEKGVYASTDDKDIGGSYVGKITASCRFSGWGGIFNTREEAEKCFIDTLNKWKTNMTV